MRVYNVKKIRALNATVINDSPQITAKKILPELTFVTKKWTAYWCLRFLKSLVFQFPVFGAEMMKITPNFSMSTTPCCRLRLTEQIKVFFQYWENVYNSYRPALVSKFMKITNYLFFSTFSYLLLKSRDRSHEHCAIINLMSVAKSTTR